MNPIQGIKRAPKWALLTAGGLSAGIIGIRLWRDRGKPKDSSQSATTVGGGTTVASTGSSPTPVIVPPVITQGGSTDSGAADAGSVLTAVSGIFTPIIDDLTGLVSTTIAGEQGTTAQWIAAFQANNEDWIHAQADGGVAPQPAAQQPTVIVNVPPPAPAPAAPTCPSSYPNRSARGCYAIRRNSNGHLCHYYQSGAVECPS